MVGSSSHIWCESCHKRRIHSTSRYRMCQPCQSAHKHAIKEERRRIKNHRAEIRGVEEPTVQAPEEPKHITVAEAVQDYLIDAAIERAVDTAIDAGLETEEVIAAGMSAGYEQKARSNGAVPPTTEPTRRKGLEPKPHLTSQQESYVRAAAALSDERKLEIGAAYEDFSVTTGEISRRFSIEQGTLYALLKLLDIRPRSQRPDFKRGPKPKVPAPQAPVVAALAAPSLPNVQASRVIEREFAQVGRWIVRVEGELEIEGDRIEDVIARVRAQYPHLGIKGVDYIG